MKQHFYTNKDIEEFLKTKNIKLLDKQQFKTYDINEHCANIKIENEEIGQKKIKNLAIDISDTHFNLKANKVNTNNEAVLVYNFSDDWLEFNANRHPEIISEIEQKIDNMQSFVDYLKDLIKEHKQEIELIEEKTKETINGINRLSEVYANIMSKDPSNGITIL